MNFENLSVCKLLVSLWKLIRVFSGLRVHRMHRIDLEFRDDI